MAESPWSEVVIRVIDRLCRVEFHQLLGLEQLTEGLPGANMGHRKTPTPGITKTAHPAKAHRLPLPRFFYAIKNTPSYRVGLSFKSERHRSHAVGRVRTPRHEDPLAGGFD